MNEQTVVEKKRNSPPRGAGGAKKLRRFTPDEKLKAVRLRLEEGFRLEDVCAEIGVAQSGLSRWRRQYREQGEAGLQPGVPGPRPDRLPAPITDKIIELKRENPTFGIKRISQLLRRCFFLPASPETVRQRLHDAELMEKGSPPKKRNLTRPRFFERATPNQMWQTDIFTFRLGGRYAYLIAFMDDYSRFIVGADLFRSPTAPSVIEVYRVAVAEFQPPKEMLTDNGRQYTSWRGVSRFEAELKKDRVAHFKSRPHHPMTLGKVERFWETIWQEFLSRAQFDSFDAARERIKLWPNRDPLGEKAFITNYEQDKSWLTQQILKENSDLPPYLFVWDNPINLYDSDGLIALPGFSGPGPGAGEWHYEYHIFLSACNTCLCRNRYTFCLWWKSVHNYYSQFESIHYFNKSRWIHMEHQW